MVVVSKYLGGKPRYKKLFDDSHVVQVLNDEFHTHFDFGHFTVYVGNLTWLWEVNSVPTRIPPPNWKCFKATAKQTTFYHRCKKMHKLSKI